MLKYPGSNDMLKYLRFNDKSGENVDSEYVLLIIDPIPGLDVPILVLDRFIHREIGQNLNPGAYIICHPDP